MEIIRTGGETNTYILCSDDKCLIIDPACRLNRLEEKIDGKEVLAILLTHGHFDHIRTVDKLVSETGCPVFLHEADEVMVRSQNQIGRYFYNASAHISSKITYLKEGAMDIGPFHFEVIFTPGHTEGSVCFLFGDDLFCGDTLFRLSCGRTDLPGGSDRKMRDSLRQLSGLSDDIVIHPGHEAESTIGFELANNPFLR